MNSDQHLGDARPEHSESKEFSRKQQILREWRLLPEKRAERPIKQVRMLIDREVASLGLKERLIGDQLAKVWLKVVGRETAQFTKPVDLQRGKLIIAVSQPAVRYDLERFHKAEILRRLQAELGAKTVRDIRFQIGP